MVVEEEKGEVEDGLGRRKRERKGSVASEGEGRGMVKDVPAQ